MLSFYLIRSMAKLISYLPWRILYVFSDGLAFLMQYVVRYRKSVIQKNLGIAFPDKSVKEREQIRAGFYRNFSDILVESVKSLSVSRKEMQSRVKLRNPEVFEQLFKDRQGVIMVMGHYANFEWTAMCISLCVPQNCFAVYHPLKNSHYNKMVVRIREQFGLTLFDMKDTYPFMLSNQDPTPLYVFMADQSPHRGKIKHYAPFFGVPTPVHLGVENLSKKCDLAVAFVKTHRMGRGRYELEAELLFEDVQDLDDFKITHKHVKVLEELIRKKPEDWLWSHKRWKHAKLDERKNETHRSREAEN